MHTVLHHHQRKEHGDKRTSIVKDHNTIMLLVLQSLQEKEHQEGSDRKEIILSRNECMQEARSEEKIPEIQKEIQYCRWESKKFLEYCTEVKNK